MRAKIQLLGMLNILIEDRPSRLLQSPKACALLIYLVMNSGVHTRQMIASLLWDNDPPKKALGKFRDLLRRIRPWLPAEVEITRHEITLQKTDNLWVDVHQLQAGLSTNNLAQIISAQGELTPRFYLPNNYAFNEWLLLARERLRRQTLLGYEQLCTTHARQERWELVLQAAQCWLTQDELDEQACLWCMRSFAQMGDYTNALATYVDYQERLWNELGVETEETAVFAQQLKQQQTRIPPIIPPPNPLPNESFVPYQRNTTFIGRLPELIQLEQLFAPQKTHFTKAVVIVGMGGMGKTQLAIEFAYRYAHFFTGGVHWLNFAHPENITTEVAHIGQLMGITTPQAPLAEQIEQVRQTLQEPTKRLLIFDNCEDEALLKEWLPTTGDCRILVTSRRANWSTALPLKILNLSGLTAVESQTFLQQQTTLSAHMAQAIALEIGHLPLALHLVAHTLNQQKHLSPQQYLQQLQTSGLAHPSLQGEKVPTTPTNHELNLKRTFALNNIYLQGDKPIQKIAQKLLIRAASLAHGEPIPITLLLDTLPTAQTDLSAILSKQDGLDLLLNLGFLQKNDPQHVRLHRLLAQFAQEQWQAPTQPTLNDIAQALTAQIGHLWEREKWVARLPFPAIHLHTIIKAMHPQQNAQTADLHHWLGTHRLNLGDYALANKHLMQALQQQQNLLEPNDTKTAKTYFQLGILAMRLAHYEQSLVYHQRALNILKNLYGKMTPKVADSLQTLGNLFWVQEQYNKAQQYYQKALQIRQATLPPNHLDIGETLHSLGTLFSRIGNYKQAQQYMQQGLQIQEAILGRTHPTIIRIFNNLGALYLRMGIYHKALPYFEQAVAGWTQTIGSTHATTLKGLNNLGFLHLRMGHYVIARNYLDKALTFKKETLGQAHSKTILGYNNLGYLYILQGEYALADLTLRKGFSLCHRNTDSVSRYLAYNLTYQGLLAFDLGHLTTARTHLQKALQLHEQFWGINNPKTLYNQQLFGALLLAQGALPEAQTVLQTTLEKQINIQGERHPVTAVTLRHLSHLHIMQRDKDKARAQLQQAYQIQQEKLHSQHPEIAFTLLIQAKIQQAVPAQKTRQQALNILQNSVLPTHKVRQQLEQALIHYALSY